MFFYDHALSNVLNLVYWTIALFVGTIYSSSLFPGRAPDDRVLILNYIGGATNPDIVNMVCLSMTYEIV